MDKVLIIGCVLSALAVGGSVYAINVLDKPNIKKAPEVLTLAIPTPSKPCCTNTTPAPIPSASVSAVPSAKPKPVHYAVAPKPKKAKVQRCYDHDGEMRSISRPSLVLFNSGTHARVCVWE